MAWMPKATDESTIFLAGAAASILAAGVLRGLFKLAISMRGMVTRCTKRSKPLTWEGPSWDILSTLEWNHKALMKQQQEDKAEWAAWQQGCKAEWATWQQEFRTEWATEFQQLGLRLQFLESMQETLGTSVKSLLTKVPDMLQSQEQELRTLVSEVKQLAGRTAEKGDLGKALTELSKIGAMMTKQKEVLQGLSEALGKPSPPASGPATKPAGPPAAEPKAMGVKAPPTTPVLPCPGGVAGKTPAPPPKGPSTATATPSPAPSPGPKAIQLVEHLKPEKDDSEEIARIVKQVMQQRAAAHQ